MPLQNDSVNTGFETAVTIPVLDNDTVAQTDLRVVSVTQPASGSVAIAADGRSVVFTPATGFSGTAQFTYQVGLATAVASVTVEVAAAPPPTGQPDLVVLAVRWSENDGATWHNGPITAGSNVWFEADVKNQGTGATPASVIIGVAFRVNGTMTAWSDTYSTSLPAGTVVSLRANGGPDGDKYWNAPAIGSYTVRAHVDDINRIPNELVETNNTLDVAVTVQAAPPVGSPPEPPPVVGGTVGSVSGGGNVFKGDATSHKVQDLVNLRCGRCRLALYPDNDYFSGAAPSPSREDAVVVALLNAGVKPYIQFEFESSYVSGGNKPQRNYTDWFNIGQAFAGRFKPNSAFLVSQGITDKGVTEWSAINEIDRKRGQDSALNYTQYRNMLEGLADGVHAEDASGRVYPGGYLSQNRDRQYTGHGYLTTAAPLINSGKLAGFDIHIYNDRSFAPIYNTYVNSLQDYFDKSITAAGITRADIDLVTTEHNVKADPIASSQNYAALYPGQTHEQVARRWFLTHFFDVHCLVRPNGSIATGGARFAWNIWNQSATEYHMVSQLSPRVERWCGKSYSMLLGLVADMSVVSASKSTGVHKLVGGGKTAWVFQNIHASWSSRFGTSFVINDIPAATTQVQVYDGFGLITTVTNPNKPSHTFSTPTGKSYLFVANAE